MSGSGDKHKIRLIVEEKALAERVHQETMRQLEQDTDREIEELKEEKDAMPLSFASLVLIALALF